jgi:hypothetical protein
MNILYGALVQSSVSSCGTCRQSDTRSGLIHVLWFHLPILIPKALYHVIGIVKWRAIYGLNTKEFSLPPDKKKIHGAVFLEMLYFFITLLLWNPKNTISQMPATRLCPDQVQSNHSHHCLLLQDQF